MSFVVILHQADSFVKLLTISALLILAFAAINIVSNLFSNFYFAATLTFQVF
jgi:hypothetical protein